MAGTDDLRKAVNDVVQGVRLAPLWWKVGIEQTVTRYRRTLLGPFWMASSMLATGLSLSVVFGAVFGQNIHEMLPFILSGVLAWGLVGGVVTDGAGTFTSASGAMQIYRLPLSFHVLLQMDRLLINFAHQIVAFWFVMAVLRLFPLPHWELLFSLPLIVLIGLCVSFPIGMLATRFRDFGLLIGVIMQVLFMLTPVFWKPTLVPPRLQWIVVYNPFAHMIAIVRQPLLGHPAPVGDWAASVMILAVTATLALISLVLFRRRVVFWL